MLRKLLPVQCQNIDSEADQTSLLTMWLLSYSSCHTQPGIMIFHHSSDPQLAGCHISLAAHGVVCPRLNKCINGIVDAGEIDIVQASQVYGIIMNK